MSAVFFAEQFCSSCSKIQCAGRQKEEEKKKGRALDGARGKRTGDGDLSVADSDERTHGTQRRTVRVDPTRHEDEAPPSTRPAGRGLA